MTGVKAILMYHSIDSSGSVISIDESTFRRHVRWLASGVVRVTPLAELEGVPDQTDAVAVTFDDGFANFATLAWPVLRDHGLTATVFVVTDQTAGTNAWPDAPAWPPVPILPLMSWHDAGRVAQEGAELGSHTRRHPHLSQLGPDAIVDEVAGSADRIRQETGTECHAFAYPYGDAAPAAVSVVSQRYARACTTDLSVVGSEANPHLLPRLDMYYFRAPGRLESWGTARFRRHLWFRSRARRWRQQLATVTRR